MSRRTLHESDAERDAREKGEFGREAGASNHIETIITL